MRRARAEYPTGEFERNVRRKDVALVWVEQQTI